MTDFIAAMRNVTASEEAERLAAATAAVNAYLFTVRRVAGRETLTPEDLVRLGAILGAHEAVADETRPHALSPADTEARPGRSKFRFAEADRAGADAVAAALEPGTDII